MTESPEAYGPDGKWPAEVVRALREHLDATQEELAARLGTRQQTVSEWETGAARPRRMGRRLLSMVAEESGFYSTDASIAGGDTSTGRMEAPGDSASAT